MRTNFILALVTGLLFCTLAMLEVPEFLSLTDDTSNDYLVTSAQETAPTVIQIETRRSESVPVVTAELPARMGGERVGRIQSRDSARSTGDLLHSLCNLRT